MLLQEDTALTCSCVGVTNVIIPYPPSMIAAEVTANPVYRRRDISHTLITETKLQMIPYRFTRILKPYFFASPFCIQGNKSS